MIQKGFANVRVVSGGGAALEKFLEHYKKDYKGGKIINPITGNVTEIKSK